MLGRLTALLLLLGSAPALASVRHGASGPAAHARAEAGRARRAMGTGGQRPQATRSPRRRQLRGARIARRAASLVGVPLSQYADRVPDDCTGLARLAYQRVGIELLDQGSLPDENGVTAIHRRAALRRALFRHRRPRPGDLVFFRDTWDRNGDGKPWNDGLTHIGVVESVDRDGTVTFIHRAGGGVKRSRMNLRFPERRGSRAEGYLNDYLRRATGGDRAYLTGELFQDFASCSRM